MNQLDTQIARLKARGYPWPVPWAVVEMMARKENCKLKAYLCPAKVWTIGWGETAEGVRQGLIWTPEQCDARFFDQVTKYARSVSQMLTAPASPNELGAMVSLAYNIGLGNPNAKLPKDKKGFYWSSVRRLHNAGDKAAAARSFALFNKGTVDGQLVEMAGLVSRRALEAAMYLTPEPSDDSEQFEQPQVQAVAQESSMASSPINKVGAALIGTGMLKTVAESSAQVSGIMDEAVKTANAVNLSPGLLLAIALLAAGVAVVYWRFKQRKQGWA